jgi:hypothetical protein
MAPQHHQQEFPKTADFTRTFPTLYQRLIMKCNANIGSMLDHKYKKNKSSCLNKTRNGFEPHLWRHHWKNILLSYLWVTSTGHEMYVYDIIQEGWTMLIKAVVPMVTKFWDSDLLSDRVYWFCRENTLACGYKSLSIDSCFRTDSWLCTCMC